MGWLFGSSNNKENVDYIKFSMQDLENVLEKAGLEPDKVEDVVADLYNNLSDKVTEKTIYDLDDFSKFTSAALGDVYVRATNTIQRAKELSQFIDNNGEVGGSIRLYASYITYGAADIQLDEYKVVLSGKNTDEVNAANELVDSFEDTTKIKRFIYPLAKDLVSFGDAYLEKIYSPEKKLIGLAYIPAKSMYPQLDDKGRPIAYYQFIEGAPDNVTQNVLMEYERKKKVIKFEPSEILHFNDGSPIGFTDSPVNNLLIQCRFMKLLEETLIIHRITRARRFIIFFLDVTGKVKGEIKRAVRSLANVVKKMFTLDLSHGQIEKDRAIVPTTSDLVIPITKDSATKVQALPSDPSATKIDDLKFYSGRITQILLTSHVFGQEKTGKEQYIQEAFFRMVRIYQKQMAFALKDIYTELLEQEGYDDLRVSIVFPSPDPTVELKIIDSVVRRMMVVNQLIATTGIVPPNEWIVEYVFKDLTMIETEQLINMLNYAKEQQNKAAAGNEYPTIFQGTGSENESEENEEESTETAGGSFELNGSQTHFFDNLFNLRNRNEEVQEKTKKYMKNLEDVMKLSMEYLESRKKLEV